MSAEMNNPPLVEKILAYSSLSIIALAVASFFATLIAALAGASVNTLASGLWPIVSWIGYVGLPVGFVLMMTLLVLNRRRRKRELLAEQRS